MATPARATRAALRDRVVASAALLLEEQGLAALTVRRLAEEAGVAPMSIYHHLGSKDGVIDELLRLAFNRLEAAMRVAGRNPDPVEAFREAGRRYRELALGAPATYGLMFAGTGLHPDASEETKLAALSSFAALVSLAQRLVDAGLAAKGSADDLAQATWSSVHGAVTLELAGLTFSADAYEYLLGLIEAGFTAGR